MSLPSCLTNIIGLSQTECSCFIDGTEPTDYNISKSGIFLDELDGFNIALAGGADDCAKGGIWDRMVKARINATTDYINNLMGCIGTNYKPRINPLNVTMGETTYKGSLNFTQSYAGQKISPMQIKGGVIILKRIGVLVNASVPVTVKVYSNVPSNGDQSTLLFTSTAINAVANTITWAALSTPLELPMYNKNQYVRYYVVYALDGTYQPKDNKKDCGCGGIQRPWLQWFDTFGVFGNDITNPEGFSTNNSANGLSLDMTVKCRTRDIICSDEYPLDFDDDGYALNIAYAIRFRAAALLYEDLLSSTIINRFTMLNRDYCMNKITEWNNEYMNWINYLCANTILDKNECLVCRSTPTTLIKTNLNSSVKNYHWLQGDMSGFMGFDMTNGK